MAAPDVVSFAVEHGFYNGSVDDLDFSFSDVFDPVTPTGARFCEVPQTTSTFPPTYTTSTIL